MPVSSLFGEPPDPAPLSGGLDRAGSVVPAGPGHGVVGGVPGEDAHAGDDGAGSAGAAAARDLDALTGPGEQVRVDDARGGMLAVARDPEVGPVDPGRRPAGPPRRS